MTSRKAKAGSSTNETKQNTADSKQRRLTPELAGEVEVTTVVPKVVEELSEDELKEQHQLELKVERAFVEADRALKLLRDKRLYREHYKTFEEYYQFRFGFQRAHSYRLINAAQVFDNLSSKCLQIGDIFPTHESQCRPLIKLEPDQQRSVWAEAVDLADGKAPSARIVKNAVLRHAGIVERLKSKNPPPPELVLGDVVEIKPTKHYPLRPFAQMWGVIERVCSFSYTVRISIARETHS